MSKPGQSRFQGRQRVADTTQVQTELSIQTLAAALTSLATAQAQRVQVWKWSALDWVKRLPRGTEFTSDDVIRDCGLADEGANRNNVVGAEFHVWARQGLIRDTGKQKKSERTARHGGRIGVWRRL